MDEIVINREGCESRGLSLREAVTLFSIDNGFDENDYAVMKALERRGYIYPAELLYRVPNTNIIKARWGTTRRGKCELEKIIMESRNVNSGIKDRVEALAEELKEIFPKGKKPGTNFYWTEGKPLIVRRIFKFFNKYGVYENEEILRAAKNYVQSFNGNYMYMKLLKYFIFKEKLNANNEVEGESELLNFMENEGQDNVNNEWTTELA